MSKDEQMKIEVAATFDALSRYVNRWAIRKRFWKPCENCYAGAVMTKRFREFGKEIGLLNGTDWSEAVNRLIAHPPGSRRIEDAQQFLEDVALQMLRKRGTDLAWAEKATAVVTRLWQHSVYGVTNEDIVDGMLAEDAELIKLGFSNVLEWVKLATNILDDRTNGAFTNFRKQAPGRVEKCSLCNGSGLHDVNERNLGEATALMHQELSEYLNALRTRTPDGAPLRDEHCPDFTNEEIELADLIIRVADLAGAKKYRIGEAIVAKMEYNITRPPKHGRKF